MTPIIVDVEASGFGQGSYPIEVGLALPDGTPHCYLISPARSWKSWDPEAEKIHGITPEVLRSYGRSLEDVAWRLNELLRNKTIYSDAWAFDMSWLGKLFDAANVPQTFRIASLRDLMDDYQVAHWDDEKKKVIDDLEIRRHRASGDARVLQETFRRTQRCAA